MNKNKDILINSKLVNITIFVFVFFMFYQMRDIFGGVFIKVINILCLILIAFTISFILYPLYKKLKNYFPKYISIGLIYTFILILIGVNIYILIPNSALINEIKETSNYIIYFINNISEKYNIDLINVIRNKLLVFTDDLLYYISNFINFLLNSIFVLILSGYFLINMDNIKKIIIKNFKNNYYLLRQISLELNNYLYAVIKIIVIQFFEYTTIFYIIGHPNFILLGILNSLTSIVPIIGVLFASFLALVTASFISIELFIKTAIIVILLPNIDTYLITPKIYKNSNKISPIISILAVFIGGTLFGITGILVSIPLTIIILTIIKHYNKKNKYI